MLEQVSKWTFKAPRKGGPRLSCINVSDPIIEMNCKQEWRVLTCCVGKQADTSVHVGLCHLSISTLDLESVADISLSRCRGPTGPGRND